MQFYTCRLIVTVASIASGMILNRTGRICYRTVIIIILIDCFICCNIILCILSMNRTQLASASVLSVAYTVAI